MGMATTFCLRSSHLKNNFQPRRQRAEVVQDLPIPVIWYLLPESSHQGSCTENSLFTAALSTANFPLRHRRSLMHLSQDSNFAIASLVCSVTSGTNSHARITKVSATTSVFSSQTALQRSTLPWASRFTLKTHFSPIFHALMGTSSSSSSSSLFAGRGRECLTVVRLGTSLIFARRRAVRRWAPARYPIPQDTTSSVFFHGELEEEVYTKQPPGYQLGGPNVACKLRLALYGLHQAPCAWYVWLRKELESMGFKPSLADPGLFVKTENSESVYILVYVDKLLVAYKSLAVIGQAKAQLLRAFVRHDLGETRFYLGFKIELGRAARTITITQKRYVSNILEKFGM
ncbi:hypothetical protein VaNZ11_012114 [Volvox africanus]|uniref:Reverse transcriptase Ty1/copia-type domain-containing protein n=1 Tax=Volvox africanus TaxID=51714 RepID=A0ABQ5SD29_9CHLO|nr:hypothetical protein VaNZ11_012114 [Volvox africanus]